MWGVGGFKSSNTNKMIANNTISGVTFFDCLKHQIYVLHLSFTTVMCITKLWSHKLPIMAWIRRYFMISANVSVIATLAYQILILSLKHAERFCF